ncbi:flagellar biosynthetic protein FliO [Alkalicoccobacillus porphyridii]|nr:flagellar biosynthetic protein FliO [Alkalicoccobacillus porphyridii]
MLLIKRYLKFILFIVVLGSISLSPILKMEAADCQYVDRALTPECQQENGDTQEDVTLGDSSNEEDSEVVFASQDSGFMTILKLIGALALIIALLYGLLRFLSKRTKSFQQSQLLENMGGVPLGPNRSVQLIKVGDRVLVVGVGDSIQLLTEIDAEDERKALLDLQQEQANQVGAPAQKAVEWATSKLKGQKISATKDMQGPDQNQASFKELFTKKLEDASTSQAELEQALKERKP